MLWQACHAALSPALKVLVTLAVVVALPPSLARAGCGQGLKPLRPGTLPYQPSDTRAPDHSSNLPEPYVPGHCPLCKHCPPTPVPPTPPAPPSNWDDLCPLWLALTVPAPDPGGRPDALGLGRPT